MGAIAETTGIVFVPSFPDWLEPLPTPAEQAMTIVTKEKAAIIRELYGKETQTEIARRIGLSHPTVCKYINMVIRGN